MKNHIVFKFIAVALCAASLLGAVAGGVGMLALTELGLYDKTLSQAKQEQAERYAQELASELALRYASRELGGASPYMVNDYYGTMWFDHIFDENHMGFQLTDSQGNLLEAQELPGGQSVEYRMEFTPQGRYLKVLEEMTRQDYNALFRQELAEPITLEHGDHSIYSALPEAGADVWFLHISYSDGHSEGVAAAALSGGVTSLLGRLYTNGEGKVVFEAAGDVMDALSLERFPVDIVFSDYENTVIYQSSYPGGVLEEWSQNHMVLRPMDQPQLESPTEPFVLYSAIPEGGVEISEINFISEERGNSCIGSSDRPLGILYDDVEGWVRFVASYEDMSNIVDRVNHLSYVSFHNMDGELVYEAKGGILYPDRDGYVVYEPTTLIEVPQEDVGVLYDAIPPEGMAVAKVTVSYADDFSESAGGSPDIGFLSYDDSGSVVFVANSPGILTSRQVVLTGIAFWDEQDNLIYQARDPQGVGTFYRSGDSLFFLSGVVMTEEAVPAAAEPQTVEETVVPTEALEAPEATTEASVAATEEVSEPATENTIGDATGAAAEPTAPTAAEPAATEVEPVPEASDAATEPVTAAEEVTVPAERALQGDQDWFDYYDFESKENMIACYVHEELPELTVTVVLAEGALVQDYAWQVMEVIYGLRRELPKLLAVCLLLFAVTAVYLCCAAGKKPGSTEVRAGGLNCISLDAYLAGGFLGEMVLFWLAAEGLPYLLDSNVQVGLGTALLMAYGACLIFVGFCFACAAQFKTPGGYWWRNSLCGRMVGLLGVALGWSVRLCSWLSAKTESVLWPGFKRLCRAVWKILKAIGALLWQGSLAALEWMKKGIRWLAEKLNRFYSLLPVTWQFLLTGFVLVFLLYIMMRTYKVGYILLGFGIFFGVLLYAASSFGILLEAAKRMAKGDLDEKVDDRLLAGCFREFAGALNSLAGVAVVAAQKQLKSERMKTELITNVSHDIKTPLTSIINYVDLLQKPHTEEQQEMYLEVLDRQSQRLKKLIEDLMEMSKASTGNMAVEIGIVDAAEAINQSLGEFADKLERASLSPVFRRPEEPVLMQADGRLVWRVMSNLLGNAVKYALPGTRIYLDLMAVDGKVIISMKNISREELNVSADELLERFVRGDASRNTEGSGLGLNIAKSLMELQKGQLQLLVDGDLFKVTLIFPGA